MSAENNKNLPPCTNGSFNKPGFVAGRDITYCPFFEAGNCHPARHLQWLNNVFPIKDDGIKAKYVQVSAEISMTQNCPSDLPQLTHEVFSSTLPGSEV